MRLEVTSEEYAYYAGMLLKCLAQTIQEYGTHYEMRNYDPEAAADEWQSGNEFNCLSYEHKDDFNEWYCYQRFDADLKWLEDDGVLIVERRIYDEENNFKGRDRLILDLMPDINEAAKELVEQGENIADFLLSRTLDKCTNVGAEVAHFATLQ